MRGTVLIAALVGGLGCATPEASAPSPDAACDPIRAVGCAAPLRCVAEDRYPLVGRCEPAGAMGEGRPCAQPGACAAGLQCIQSRCLRPCAEDRDCPQPDARCGVSANSVQWSACTLPGDCDDRDAGSCPLPRVCRPTTPFGLGRCIAEGVGADGAPCSDPLECDARHTCFITGGGALGRCRPTCSPIGMDCAARRQCVPFVDRPIDYGACLP